MVPLDDICDKINEISPVVKDSNGIERKIRDINMPAYRYLLENFDTL